MDKKTFRQQARESLRHIPSYQRRVIDHRVNAILLQSILQKNAQTVMLYLPLKDEVNVLPLIDTLRQRGITVLVPFMEGTSFRLVQYRQPLHTKRFGIREPRISRKYRSKKIDIAIVPIVGTDLTLRRVGLGKGMYDRFFAREGRWIKETIFIQRRLQWSPAVITDAWDVTADVIVVGTVGSFGKKGWSSSTWKRRTG